MGWAAALLGGSVLASRFMGLARDKVISYYFGASEESDVYFAAFVIPDFINYLLAGAYFSITLIPLLTELFRKSDEEAWRFFSAVTLWTAVTCSVLCALVILWAHPLAHWAAPGLSPQAATRLAFFLRIVAPAQVFFLLGSCFSAVLYFRKQFQAPALSPLIYNAFIIALGLLMRRSGMSGFCWGVLVGAFVGNFLLPVMAVRYGGGFRWQWTVWHPAMKKFFALALPLMVGQSVVVLDEQLMRVFGSLAAIGAISWLNYARRIMLVPVGVVAQAAGTASYPYLAETYGSGDMDRFFETLNTAFRNTLTILIPLSLWMILTAKPIIVLVFQQGRFNTEDTVQTVWALRILLAVVFCWGIQQILGRAYYARQDMVTPAVIGTLCTVAVIPFYYIAVVQAGARGVAAVSAFSVALYTTLLCLWWRHRLGSRAFQGLLISSLKVTFVTVAAAVPSAAALFWTTQWNLTNPYAQALCQLALSGLVFALAFLGLGRLWAKDSISPLWDRLPHAMRRRSKFPQ
ncbi:murein biosynthesis integral membrane protein MurJ [Desulfosoma caldarium]|nr:murein biosynthesis integral membrane protein MurJ [Desulfosoma caldarium]